MVSYILIYFMFLIFISLSILELNLFNIEPTQTYLILVCNDLSLVYWLILVDILYDLKERHISDYMSVVFALHALNIIFLFFFMIIICFVMDLFLFEAVTDFYFIDFIVYWVDQAVFSLIACCFFIPFLIG